MGVQLFGGSLDRQCVDGSGVIMGSRRCSNHHKPWAYMCPDGTTCEHTFNWPADNLTSFANLPRAAIVLFEAISLEGWSDNMYATVDAEGFWAVFYWITVVVFGESTGSLNLVGIDSKKGAWLRSMCSVSQKLNY